MRPSFIAIAVTLFTLSSASLGAAAISQPTAPVLLKNSVVVDGPVVHLGDLFDGLGEEAATPVVRAPAPGKRVQVNARWLAAVAQAFAVAWRPSSQLDSSVIARSSIVIENQQIEDATIDALRRRGIKGNLSLILDNPALRLHLPSDVEPSLMITGLTHNPQTGRFTAHLVAPAEGAPMARATISGRAVEMVEVPVLRRRMLPGAVIRDRDIEWRDVRADRLGRNVVRDQANLVGKSPRRPIRANEPVRGNELREPILVPKNSLVTIRLQTARMVLTARGRAMEQGAQGDVIRVVNTKSNTIISASVTKPGIVEVISAGLRAAD